MKRILFIHNTSEIGGGSYCLLNIIKVLNRNNYEPFVALPSEGPLCAELRNENIPVILFPSICTIPYNQGLLRPNSIKRYINTYLSSKRLVHILKQYSIDILYLNTLLLYPYLRPANRNGCKSIIHIREHWPKGEHAFQLSYAKSYLKKYANQIIAINTYCYSLFPSLNHKTNLVYDWIDFSERNRYVPLTRVFDSGTSSKIKILLFTGGLSKIKGAREVMRLFSDHITEKTYRLLILGQKPSINTGGIKHRIKHFLSWFGYDYYLESILSIVNNDERIKFIDSTYNIKSIIEQSYAFVSFYTIPHANLALAENIILGNICIAARTSESIEYSFNESLAFLFTINNENDFLRAFHRMEEEYDSMKERLNEKKKVVADLFDKEKNVKTLYMAFSRL